MWPVLEPKPLEWNWHLDIICRELTWVFEGKTKELVICIPPGTAKSLLVSVLWPAWVWLHRPTERVLCFANHPRLASRDSKRMRGVLDKPQYKALVAYQAKVGNVREVRDRKTGKKRAWAVQRGLDKIEKFVNDYEGFRESTSIGSAVTGRRGDGIIIDDPYDADQVINGSVAQVAARMLAMVNLYENSITSRVNDETKAYKILIMQRLHLDDLAGHMVRNGARHVALPMLSYEPIDVDRHPDDPRQGAGESLQERRFPAEVVTEKRRRMVARHFDAQYQQKPRPAAGKLFKREWVQYHRLSYRMAEFDEIAISVDCTFKDEAESDYVVMQAWGRKGAKFYLLDQVRDRMNYVETRKTLIAFRKKHARTRLVLIEDKANGSALISELRAHVPGIVAYDPGSASKYARAELSTVAWEAGNVFLPDPEIAPWVGDLVEEHISFPGGTNDDQVDAGSQMLLRWMDLTDYRELDPLREFAAFATPIELNLSATKNSAKQPDINW